MDWKAMKLIEPELARLEESAHNAGLHQATWIDVLFATNEATTKCCGHGAHDERLRSDRCYEVARAAIFAAWSRGCKGQPVPEPPPFLDVSEAYR